MCWKKKNPNPQNPKTPTVGVTSVKVEFLKVVYLVVRSVEELLNSCKAHNLSYQCRDLCLLLSTVTSKLFLWSADHQISFTHEYPSHHFIFTCFKQKQYLLLKTAFLYLAHLSLVHKLNTVVFVFSQWLVYMYVYWCHTYFCNGMSQKQEKLAVSRLPLAPELAQKSCKFSFIRILIL